MFTKGDPAEQKMSDSLEVINSSKAAHSCKLTLVAMATKFGTKWAITLLLYEIPAKFLRPYGVRGCAVERCNPHFSQPTPVAMATKFGTKWAFSRLL